MVLGILLGILAFVIIYALVVVFAILMIEYDHNKRTILEKSQRVKSLLDLNKTIVFRKIQSSYFNQTTCNSKRQLDNLDMDNYLASLIESNEVYYRHIVEAISYNRETYDSYVTLSSEIESTVTEDYCKSLGFTLTKFCKWEERIFKKNLLRKPQWNIIIRCKATYTSPAGKNHYWKDKCYTYPELKDIFDETMERKAERQTRQYQIKLERAKMSNGLRWDILARDGYRCQICGSTAQDGVKLQVDHIIPVSKGGKTTPSNLRTLCDRCNSGKSDKL